MKHKNITISKNDNSKSLNEEKYETDNIQGSLLINFFTSAIAKVLILRFSSLATLLTLQA